MSPRKYRRRTKEVDALIAGAYLSGTNTRRVGRALASLFKGAVSKSVVSRVWRKIKADWDNWNKRDLASEDIVRLILDGTRGQGAASTRKATAISLLVVLGVRRDGQKVLLAVKNMGGESEAAWRTILDDLTKRGMRKPELAIVDGAPGLEKALVTLWSDLPIQRCTVHKLRNLRADENVLEIVGGRTLLLDRLVKLAIESVQFLVEGLQLFFRGLQFLVRRLEFLVDGHRLFIDRLLLFDGDREVAHGRPAGPRGLHRVPAPAERSVVASAAATHRRGEARSGAWFIEKTDEKQAFAVVLATNWADGDANADRSHRAAPSMRP